MSQRGRAVRRARWREGGFSLLETIVALVLVASTGLALMSWINTSLIEVNRLQEREGRARLLLAATEAVQTIDPMSRPEGQMSLGSVSLQWQAEPASPSMRSAGFEGAGMGMFDVRLFTVRAQARDSASGAEVAFDATLVGYRYVGAGREKL